MTPYILDPLTDEADRMPSEAALSWRRRGLARFWHALPSYIAVQVLLWLGVSLHSMQPGVAWVLTGGNLMCLTTIYLALRRGWPLRSPDPMLAFAQSTRTIALLSVGYALLDDLRSTALL